MTRLTLSLPFAVAVALTTSAVGHAKATHTDKGDTTAAPALSKEDQQKLREHIRMKEHISKHVKYPATKQDLIKACKGVSEVKASDKKWFEATLPDRTYNSAEEVEKALGWEVSPAETPAPAGK